jgi:uncharacterized protein (TIGR03435 family)
MKTKILMDLKPFYCAFLYAAADFHAQSSGTGPSFEVASIKPSTQGGRHGVYTDGSPGQVLMLSMTLKQLITFAYDMESYRIVGAGLPTDSYDVIARVPEGVAKLPDDARWDRIHTMTQALLADRFRLAVHRGTTEMSVYRLTVARGGLKIRELGPNPGENVVVKRRPGYLSAEQMPMSQLVSILRGELKRPVVDETGVKGVFDVTLIWTPEDSARSAQRSEDSPSAVADPGDGPSLLTAIEEQLGFELLWGKSTIDVITVDHAEKASEN